MANKRIKDLTAGSLARTDALAADRDGGTIKTTPAGVLGLMEAGDVPELSIEKTTGLQDALDAKATMEALNATNDAVGDLEAGLSALDSSTTSALAANSLADRARANHTGTQAISTVTGLQAALDAKADSSAVTSAIGAASTADRDRANHTGTQAISTVAGLQTALDGKADDSDLAAYTPTVNLAELIRDTIAAALVAGANITITPNDGSDTITIAATGGGGGSPGGADGDIQVNASGAFAGSLLKQGTNLVQQKSGSTPQELQVYGSATEYNDIQTSGGIAWFGADGTNYAFGIRHSDGLLVFQLGGQFRWVINPNTFAIAPQGNGQYDLGTSLNRLRDTHVTRWRVFGETNDDPDTGDLADDEYAIYARDGMLIVARNNGGTAEYADLSDLLTWNPTPP